MEKYILDATSVLSVYSWTSICALKWAWPKPASWSPRLCRAARCKRCRVLHHRAKSIHILCLSDELNNRTLAAQPITPGLESLLSTTKSTSFDKCLTLIFSKITCCASCFGSDRSICFSSLPRQLYCELSIVLPAIVCQELLSSFQNLMEE